MSIIERWTPVYYKMNRLGFQREGGEVVVLGDIRVYSVNGDPITTDNPTTALTPQEKQQLGAFVNSKLADYETATGLQPLPPELEEA